MILANIKVSCALSLEFLESLGSERGIITKVEVDVALERAIGAERSPAAAAHIVALVGALPRELNPQPAITIRIAAVEFSPHHDEAQTAEAVIIALDEAGLDQIDGFLIPVVHLGDTPPAYDAHALGHATRVAFVGTGAPRALEGADLDEYYVSGLDDEPTNCRR